MMTSDPEDPENPSQQEGKQDTMPDSDAASKKSKTENETTGKRPSLGRIFSLAKPEIPMLIISTILMIASEGTNLITPLIVAQAFNLLVDADLKDDDLRMSEISNRMVFAIFITLIGTIGTFIRSSIQGIIGERVVARLRCQLYAGILKQEIAFFDEHKSGELNSRLGSDTTLLQSVISDSLPEFLGQLITAIAAMLLMFFLSLKLAGLALGGVVLIFILSFPMGQLMGRLSKDYQDILGQAQTHSTEAIGSMRTVQGFAAESKELNRYNAKIGNPDDIPWWWPSRRHRTTYRLGVLKSIVDSGFYTFVFGAGFGFLNVTLWYGFYLVIQGEMTLGDLTAFNSFIITIGFSMGQMAGSVAAVFEGMGASGRVFYLLDRVPNIPKPPPKNMKYDTVKPESMEGNIELQNVIFHYPSRPDQIILNNISLKMPANTTTALVGTSGTGVSKAVCFRISVKICPF